MTHKQYIVGIHVDMLEWMHHNQRRDKEAYTGHHLSSTELVTPSHLFVAPNRVMCAYIVDRDFPDLAGLSLAATWLPPCREHRGHPDNDNTIRPKESVVAVVDYGIPGVVRWKATTEPKAFLIQGTLAVLNVCDGAVAIVAAAVVVELRKAITCAIIFVVFGS